MDGEIVRLKNAVTERDHTSGKPGAPITLVEYGNFQCIHCGRAYPVIKELQKVLGDSLRFVFRHFPTVATHPLSLRAAEASEAAGAQGKFWEMHDQLFTHQQALEDDDLVRYASRLGLDTRRFDHDLAENTFLNLIETDYNHSLFDEHITGTPTLYINDLRYTGAVDVESLLEAIKQVQPDERIPFPEDTRGIRSLFARLRRRPK
jgi:protein-disulfide isomerase